MITAIATDGTKAGQLDPALVGGKAANDSERLVQWSGDPLDWSGGGALEWVRGGEVDDVA